MSESQYPQYDPHAVSDVCDDDQPPPKPPRWKWPGWLKPVWPSPIVISIMGVILVATFIIAFWPRPVANVPSPERTIPTASTTPTANILTRIDQAYGPWQIVSSGAEAPGKILLIDTTGAMKAGMKLSVDDTWQTSVTPIITDKTLNLSKGTVTFRLSENVTVTVLANQPFILKQAPELIYSYRDGGNLVARPIGA